MEVIKNATMSNGTNIQIEDWHSNYDFMPEASTLAAYTKSKASHNGSFSPKANEDYRFQFDFKSCEDAMQAFDNLLNGKKELKDYIPYMYKREYQDCL